ncbi:hypothetical protein THRCLA_06671 [Thraustotheca clavata]|uniref:SPRY domain-containing protein n=1 Tax=Thraustotheca clavata TaxID=74557 RepID=A0A1V9ZLV4_9STRA|nr:hypothetical protein THRCLA_06671 [Thraustotheca clavata]
MAKSNDSTNSSTNSASLNESTTEKAKENKETSHPKRPHEDSTAKGERCTKKLRVQGLRWSFSKCSATMVLSNSNQTMVSKKILPDAWNCVRTTESSPVFKIRVDAQGPESEDNSDVWVGFCKADAFDPNGDTRGRFCQLLRPTQSCGIDDIAASVTVGDVITCYYDRESCRIWFKKNDVDVGLSYDEVDDAERFPVVVTNCDGLSLTLIDDE